MSRFWLQLAAAAIFLAAWTQSAALEPRHDIGILPIDPPTPYDHYLPAGSPRGRVLVIHGLDVSKEVLSILSAAIADSGFEVYTIDLPGHGDSRLPFSTDLAQQAIWNSKTYLGAQTIVLGHSLGAGLLLDLAASRHFSTMILLAPPPLAISEIQADRALIATGAIDIPRIRVFTPIAADVGGANVEFWILPWGGHSAAVFNPVYIRRIVEWFGGDGAHLRTPARIIWIVVMLVAGAVFGVTLMPARQGPAIPSHIPGLLATYMIACGVSLLFLRFTNPLKWLRLFATDYLIGFLLVTGLCLLLVAATTTKTQRPKGGLLKGIAAAGFVILVPGLLTGSHLLHMTLSDGRWWRFPLIVFMGLPLFLSDELLIRRIGTRWKPAAVAIVTRGLLTAFVLTGVLMWNRESGFLVMIVPLLAIFWMALWFASGVVHRHTQDPIATALFAAIVQGWAFAAWFVTI